MSPRLFTALICLISVIVLLILNAFVTGGTEMGVIASAWGLALIHVLSGFFMSRWAMEKSSRQFMTIVLGGIGLRLMLVAAALFALMPWIRVSLELFIITFVVFYILFQIVEVYFIHRGLQQRRLIRTREIS